MLRIDLGWRSGYDNQQHLVVMDNPRGQAVCRVYVKPIRYDRPDWPRCRACLKNQ
jgi:hypothetical protein